MRYNLLTYGTLETLTESGTGNVELTADNLSVLVDGDTDSSYYYIPEGVNHYAVWNWDDMGSQMSLSADALHVTRNGSSNSWQGIRAYVGLSSGKWYWEVTNRGRYNRFFSGIATTTMNVDSQYPGQVAGSCGYYSATGNLYYEGANTSFGVAIAENDVVGTALDLDNNKIWFSRNGEWQGPGSPDPVSGTDPAQVLPPGTYYPSVGLYYYYYDYDLAEARANFGATDFSYINTKKITASDKQQDDYFGHGVSIYGDTAIVGAHAEDTGGANAGALYVYTLSGNNTWSEKQKIMESYPAASNYFGHGLDIYEDTIVIGSHGDDVGGTNAGSAYIFTLSGTTWVEHQKLQASDVSANSSFGVSAGIYEDTVLVGAHGEDTGGTDAGAAYIFTLSGTTWIEQQKLQASDKQAGDYFGHTRAVAIYEDTAVVGAYGEDAWGTDAGAAYIFTRSGTTWTEQQKITASDIQAGDQFGRAVSVYGDTAIFGSQYEDTGGSNAGAAYIFTRSGTVWTEQQKIMASDAQASDEFGQSVSIYGNTVLVGALYEDSYGSNAGASYIFTLSGTTWTQQQKIQGSDRQADDRFGTDVCIHESTAIIGAYCEDAAGSNAGAAYIVKLDETRYPHGFTPGIQISDQGPYMSSVSLETTDTLYIEADLSNRIKIDDLRIYLSSSTSSGTILGHINFYYKEELSDPYIQLDKDYNSEYFYATNLSGILTPRYLRFTIENTECVLNEIEAYNDDGIVDFGSDGLLTEYNIIEDTPDSVYPIAIFNDNVVGSLPAHAYVAIDYTQNVIEGSTIHYTPSYVDVALGGDPYAQSSQGGHEPIYAIDDDTGTYWNSGASAPAWWAVDLGEVVVLREIVVYSRTGTMLAYTLYGSLDGVLWNTLDTVMHSIVWPKTHILTNNCEYRYLKINITSSDGWSNWCTLASVEVYTQTETHIDTGSLYYNLELSASENGPFYSVNDGLVIDDNYESSTYSWSNGVHNHTKESNGYLVLSPPTYIGTYETPVFKFDDPYMSSYLYVGITTESGTTSVGYDDNIFDNTIEVRSSDTRPISLSDVYWTEFRDLYKYTYYDNNTDHMYYLGGQSTYWEVGDWGRFYLKNSRTMRSVRISRSHSGYDSGLAIQKNYYDKNNNSLYHGSRVTGGSHTFPSIFGDLDMYDYIWAYGNKYSGRYYLTRTAPIGVTTTASVYKGGYADFVADASVELNGTGVWYTEKTTNNLVHLDSTGSILGTVSMLSVGGVASTSDNGCWVLDINNKQAFAFDCESVPLTTVTLVRQPSVNTVNRMDTDRDDGFWYYSDDGYICHVDKYGKLGVEIPTSLVVTKVTGGDGIVMIYSSSERKFEIYNTQGVFLGSKSIASGYMCIFPSLLHSVDNVINPQPYDPVWGDNGSLEWNVVKNSGYFLPKTTYHQARLTLRTYDVEETPTVHNIIAPPAVKIQDIYPQQSRNVYFKSNLSGEAYGEYEVDLKVWWEI